MGEDKPTREGLPLEEGLHGDREVASDPVEMADRWSQNATLAALSEEYTFFTHGLFFTYGGMQMGLQDPVQDFVNNQPGNIQPMILDLDRKMFANMGTRREHGVWNHRLIGVPNDTWPALMQALAGVASIDRRRNFYWQSTRQQVEILDPLVMMRASVMPNPPPRVKVWVFGIDSNKRVVVFPESYDLVSQLPGPVEHPARPEIVNVARAMLTMDPAAAVKQEIERGHRDTTPPGDGS